MTKQDVIAKLNECSVFESLNQLKSMIENDKDPAHAVANKQLLSPVRRMLGMNGALALDVAILWETASTLQGMSKALARMDEADLDLIDSDVADMIDECWTAIVRVCRNVFRGEGSDE